MEFFLNFDKPHISEKVINFLEINISDEEAKGNLARISKGLKLSYKEANAFIDTILKAMTIEDGKADIPFTTKKSNEDGKEELVEVSNDTQKSTQPIVQTDTQKEGTCAPIANNKNTPITVKKEICHFFTINKCKFGKDCRKAHPKMCPKFKKFGLKKFNKSGCEESCVNYHPKACFEAMKSKTCSRTGCKFYHVSGTKKSEGVTTPTVSTSNSFNPIAQSQATNVPVFQKAKEPWELAIEKMSAQMEMMMRWQQLQMNNQENANFDRNNYIPAPNPNLRPQTNWATQSQSQSQSQ